MPEIESIEKIIVAMKFTKTTPGSAMFISAINMPPNRALPIDEVIIRNVRWITKPLDEKFYSIWTNISNGFIAGWQKWGSLPRTVYHPPPNDVMEFRLYFLEIASEPLDEINGQIYIDLEFISYKKNY